MCHLDVAGEAPDGSQKLRLHSHTFSAMKEAVRQRGRPPAVSGVKGTKGER